MTQGYYVELEDSILETFSATPDIYYTQYEAFSNPPERLRHVASCGCMIGEDSKGEVRPGSNGRSQITYHVEDRDKARIVRGCHMISKIYFAAGASEVLVPRHGAATVKDQASFERAFPETVPLHDLTLYASHPLGTCRMGADPKRSVVGPTGEAHDLKNLYIADASVFPTSLGVNPQITVMTTAITVARQAVKA